MFTIKIFIKLLFKSFSLKKSSLRFISIRRVLVVITVVPSFLFLTLINSLFLLLDEICFPFYRNQKLESQLFITGIPRSATTFLFHLLAKDKKHFFYFKLWEILFAPSIIQKYFFIGLKNTDNLIGHPIYKSMLFLDKLIFGSFRDIHSIGLAQPEEDEAFFLFNLSSVYFLYFFPEVMAMNDILYFDKIKPTYRKRLMNFYFRCLQRHYYIFNRDNSRMLLSKNPTFTPKLKSLSEVFPNAQFIYCLRSPYKTIPATISLNANIYKFFCSLKVKYPLIEETRNMVFQWYIMADEAIKYCLKERCLVIKHQDITKKTKETIVDIFKFLKIKLNSEFEEIILEENLKSKSFKSKHSYDQTIGIDSQLIEKEIGHILSDDLLEIV